jgi:hypothetical protein
VEGREAPRQWVGRGIFVSFRYAYRILPPQALDLLAPQSSISYPKFPIPIFVPPFVSRKRIPNPQSKILNPQFPNSWYTTPRAPIGADVSGNCFDHYRSMPDGNQVGLFCCQTRRFRKEVSAASRQWNVSRGAFPQDGSRRSSRRDRGTELSKQPLRCHREWVRLSNLLPREELACFSTCVMAQALQEF